MKRPAEHHARPTVHPLTAADGVRRLAGEWFEALGFGPIRTPAYRVHVGDGFEVVRYAELGFPALAVLLVPAPIKADYIFDLAPEVSVVRRCLERGLRVYLLRWTPHRARDGELGLTDYAGRMLAQAIEVIEAMTRDGGRPGHSLGGTLAAIFAAVQPHRVRGLVLLEAPLRFGTGAFEAMLTLAPRASTVTRLLHEIPGSLLSLAAASAAPDLFMWQRWLDRLHSGWDPEAFVLHHRVERWALDERPMSARLFEDVLELLYRKNSFARAMLTVGACVARPERVTAPLVAVVNPRSRLVPPSAVVPFLESAGSRDKMLLHYEGDCGVALQHVGALVGRTAHAAIWPCILDWIARRA